MNERPWPATPVVGSGWQHCNVYCRNLRAAGIKDDTHVYRHGALQVLSSAEMAQYRGDVVPTNHVSVRHRDRRATNSEVEAVRRAFDMVDAEEDNHQPGMIRNLFLPLHLPRGTVGVCECKESEETVVEADGFTWSRTRR